MSSTAGTEAHPTTLALWVWLPSALLLLVAPVVLGATTERFGSVAVTIVLLLALLAAGSNVSWWPVAAVLSVLAAVLLPGSVGETVSAVLATVLAWGLAAGSGLLRATTATGQSSAPVGSRVCRSETGSRSVPAADSTEGSLLEEWGPPVLGWLGMALVVNAALSISGSLAGTFPDGRIVWDASNFIAIARDGYSGDIRLAASFPGYAMLIRGVTELLGIDRELAAVLISDVAGLASGIVFWKWCRRFLERGPRLVALALYLCFPYAFVLYGVAYADGVLLAFLFGALLAIEHGRHLLAGLLGAGATFTRPNGLVIIPVLMALALERSGALVVDSLFVRGAGWRARLQGVRFLPSALRWRQLGVVVAGAGIGAFMFWMWRLFDDPLFFWSVQTTEYGHRAFADPQTWFKVEFINRPSEFVHNGPDAFNQLVSMAIIVCCVVSLPPVARRFGWSYALLGIGSLATLWVTATGFSPAGRYLLPYIPVVLALVSASLLAHRRFLGLVLTTSVASSVMLATAFASSYRLNW